MNKNLNGIHKPSFTEKLFFLFSGAIISTPFPALANSFTFYTLFFNMPQKDAFFISAVIVAPLIEEFAKAYPLFFRHGETERSIVSLGFLTGLGFGITEFFLYTAIYQISPFVRLPMVLLHATNSSITAYGISQNKAFHFYLIAVILHFLNNYFASLGPVWVIASGATALVSFTLSIFLFLRSREKLIAY